MIVRRVSERERERTTPLSQISIIEYNIFYALFSLLLLYFQALLDITKLYTLLLKRHMERLKVESWKYHGMNRLLFFDRGAD